MLRATMIITHTGFQKPTYATVCTAIAEGNGLMLQA